MTHNPRESYPPEWIDRGMPPLDSSVDDWAARDAFIRDGHADVAPHPSPTPGGDHMTTREETLRETYWTLRDHAAAYRATNGFRKARERWEASDRSDDRLYVKTAIHQFYAQGIEAAAEDIAEMLGVPEHEIERDGA